VVAGFVDGVVVLGLQQETGMNQMVVDIKQSDLAAEPDRLVERSSRGEVAAEQWRLELRRRGLEPIE